MHRGTDWPGLTFGYVVYEGAATQLSAERPVCAVAVNRGGTYVAAPLFRRLKGFRRIFSRFDKLDVVFAFSHPLRELIIEALKSVNTP